MERREFLLSAAMVAGFARTSPLWAQAGNAAKLARLGISSRSLGTIIKMGPGATGTAPRTVDPLDLAQMVADRFGVHNVEFQHAHFMSTEAAYLKDLKDRVAKARSQIVQINTEFFQSNASSSGPSLRQSIDLAKQWIDHAEALGCPRLQISAGPLAENVRSTAIETLKTIAGYANAHKVTISIENMDNGVVPPPPPAPPAPPPPPPPAADAPASAAAGARAAAQGAGRRAGGGGGAGTGGGRANAPARPATWQTIADVAKASGVLVSPNVAGFPTEAERVAGLKALIPIANGNCHVSLDPGKIDLAAAVKTCQDAGYKGLYSIATDGSGADPWAATKAVLDELVKLI